MRRILWTGRRRRGGIKKKWVEFSTHFFYFEFLFRFPHNYAVPGRITSICQRAALGRTGPDFQFFPVHPFFYRKGKFFQRFQIFPELATPATPYIFYLCWGRAPREIFPARPAPTRISRFAQPPTRRTKGAPHMAQLSSF